MIFSKKALKGSIFRIDYIIENRKKLGTVPQNSERSGKIPEYLHMHAPQEGLYACAKRFAKMQSV